MSIKNRDLPAGLGHTGNHAGVGKLAESDTGEVEATQECVATTGELAAVHLAYGGSVSRQHRQTDVVALSLQLGAEVCVASRDSCLFLISFDPAFLSHNFVRADFTGFSFIVKIKFGICVNSSLFLLNLLLLSNKSARLPSALPYIKRASLSGCIIPYG